MRVPRPTRRHVICFGGAIAAMYVALLLGATLETRWALGLDTCTTSDAAGSSFDTGEASVQWMPPAVRCSWQGRHPDDSVFPVAGVIVVLAVPGAVAAAIAFPVWAVRRARRQIGIDA